MNEVIKLSEGHYGARCRRCKEVKPISCTSQQLYRWNQGELVQRAMPTVPADERELLISGYCGACWKAIFGDDE